MAEQNPPGFLQNAGDTHTAAQLRNYIATLTAGRQISSSLRPKGGVHPRRSGNLAVNETGTPSMAVEVSGGMALVPGSESSTQSGYWVFNDATVTESVDASHATLPRIDIAVLQVRDAFYSGASNDWFIDVVSGTPASSPVAPTAPANSLTLAEILVPAASTTVVNANITDKRDYLAALGGVQFGNSDIIAAYDIAGFHEGQLFFAQDTNELTIKIGSAREPVWFGNLGKPQVAVKTTDQNLTTSSTTFQNVTSLSLPVVVGTYAWKVVAIHSSASNTPDVKFAFTFPTTSSTSFASWGLALAVTGAGPYSMNPQGGTLTTATEFMESGTIGTRTASMAWGHFVFTATGTLQLQAAQNTSDGTAVTIHAGSQLEIVRTA